MGSCHYLELPLFPLNGGIINDIRLQGSLTCRSPLIGNRAVVTWCRFGRVTEQNDMLALFHWAAVVYFLFMCGNLELVPLVCDKYTHVLPRNQNLHCSLQRCTVFVDKLEILSHTTVAVDQEI